MTYMIEGGSSANITKARRWLFAHKKDSTRLMGQLTQLIIDYLVLQVKAGAQVRCA